MRVEYSTNGWPGGYGFYVLLGDYHTEDSWYMTGDDIDFLISIGYEMVFLPAF